MSEHTPEPWAYTSDEDGFYVEGADTTVVAEVGVEKVDFPLKAEDAQHFTACVNACAGIKNPEAVGEAKQALEKIYEYWNGYTDDGSHSALVDACYFARETAEAALAALEGAKE